MGKARASLLVEGPVPEVEALWIEPARWPSWIDGFGHVVSLIGPWPEPGAVLDWNSRPGGRGRVRERVAEHRAGERLVTHVEDEQLTGTQEVAFLPADDGDIRVELTLEYSIKDRNALTPLVDAVFIRRSMSASLQRSLGRFASERAADADLR